MKEMVNMNDKYIDIINKYGKDILNNDKYKSQSKFMQHGKTSVLEHEYNVCVYCLKLIDKFKIKVDERALVRGALLHDYFLYDWHEFDKSHSLHGFSHAKKAMINANRDFGLNKIEKNMILTHMFPLNLRIPRYKESIILCIADKIVATKETVKRK